MSSLRDRYVIGRMGSYLCPTVDRVDVEIAKLTARLHGATARDRAIIIDDVDRLLERRTQLSEAR